MPIEPGGRPGGEARRASIERNEQNRARLAVADARLRITNGNGVYQHAKVADFDLTFAERPAVAACVELDLDATMDLMGAETLAELVLPTITPCVFDWDEDERGFYTGAWCGAIVNWPTGATIPDGFVFHVHYTFTATAIKDVDPGVRE